MPFHLVSLLGMWGSMLNVQGVVSVEYCIQLTNCNVATIKGWILFLSDTSFYCGTALQDYITNEISDDHILRHVFV